MLSIMFDVSQSTISRIVYRMWPVLLRAISKHFVWPSPMEWKSMRGTWAGLRNAVGCIDGTSHEIFIPTVSQRYFYSGHRKYHWLHTQIIIDAKKKIRYVESGFKGRNNDAQIFRMMWSIGKEDNLNFPPNCQLLGLGDSIYPNRHPILTLYTTIQIRRQPRHRQRMMRQFNKRHRSKRCYVEHAIRLVKIFRVIGTLYRQKREHISVCLCAFLAAHRSVLFF